MIEALVAWFQENQRPLPWRVSYNPYHVWVSEVMLQQTQVETASALLRTFHTRITNDRIALREQTKRRPEVVGGLGYYRRAKNLMAAARQIMENHGGQIHLSTMSC
jgi:A/G-specific adenine glycosylase